MAVLGERKKGLGQAWHVPNDRPDITQREFGELIFETIGQQPKIGSTGRWMMWIGALFLPKARETVEMMYEFEKPFFVDSTKFEQAFQMSATPVREGIRRTVEWYRAHLQHQEG
jgi:nucleoside-diphosphate-sugar epimerase